MGILLSGVEAVQLASRRSSYVEGADDDALDVDAGSVTHTHTHTHTHTQTNKDITRKHQPDCARTALRARTESTVY